MAVNPSPPSDLPSLVEAYRAVVTSFADVADGLRESDWDLPTACPGWTPRDHLAHVVHVEDYLSGSEHPVAGWADTLASAAVDTAPISVGAPEHVRHDLGAWLEEGVRARRRRDPRELTSELRGLMEIRSASMYDADLDLDTPVRAPMGEQMPFGELTRLRLMDIWLHEQDLREALSRPGSLDSAGASQWTDHVLGALTQVVLERVRPEPGTVVILESTGPVTGRAGVRVSTETDEEGRPVGHELFTGHADDGDQRTPEEVDAEETTIIQLSTEELGRRAAGRRSTEETAYQVSGDEDLARRVLDAYVLTP